MSAKRGFITALSMLVTLPMLAQSEKDKPAAPTQSASLSAQRALMSQVEGYLRNLFAWGPDFQIKLGPVAPSVSPDFLEVPVQVTYQGHTDSGSVYVSKDGKYMLRGEIRQIGDDPFAANRSLIHPDGSPSKGPADAAVTVVDFSDYECPHCRELAGVLKQVQPKYPQVRFVSKNFPLVQIHPWAMNAAIASHCAYEHSPAAYWLVHDAIFQNQDLISPENAWDKLAEYATSAGVPEDQFKACMVSAQAKQAVEADIAEAQALKITSTPTVYVNGREIVGGDEATLSQYITFELAKPSPPHP